LPSSSFLQEGKATMKYEVKIRFQGHVSWIEVDANNAAQAKELVRQQYGPEVDVIYCKVAGK
jgi:Tfp pilus assembly ATPase PilU